GIDILFMGSPPCGNCKGRRNPQAVRLVSVNTDTIATAETDYGIFRNLGGTESHAMEACVTERSFH
ncbi:MAG: hypothetical protein WBB60_08305, partial [Nitrospira sp.]